MSRAGEGFAIAAGPTQAVLETPRRLRLFTRGGGAVTVTRDGRGSATAVTRDDVVTVFDGAGRDEAYLFATPLGVEELVVAAEDLHYDVELPPSWRMRVPRGRDDAVEIVDGHGAPRLRMLAPAAWDADGKRHTLHVRADDQRIHIPLPEGRRPLLVDPQWQSGATSSVRRLCPSPTLLADGRVLLTGLAEDGLGLSRAAEIYDPHSDTYALVGDMNAEGCLHTATLLADGRVLVVGGVAPGGVGDATSLELFDPGSGMFVEVSANAAPRQLHTATRLHSGEVLLVGGYAPEAGPDYPSWFGGNTALADVEVFDPNEDSLESRTAMPSPRGYHRATLLPGGDVVVTGGGQSLEDQAPTSILVYQTATDAWTTVGQLQQARLDHAATLLPHGGASGQILLSGGFHWADPQGPVTTDELIDLATMQVSSLSPIPPGVEPQVAVMGAMLPNGSPRLLIGDLELVPFLTTQEHTHTFDIATTAYLPAESVSFPAMRSLTLLAGGDALLVTTPSARGSTQVARLASEAHSVDQLGEYDFYPFDGEPCAQSVTPLITGDMLAIFAQGLEGRGESLGAVAVGVDPPSVAPVSGLDGLSAGHSATTLADGTLLLVGGAEPARVFDPRTGAVESVAALAAPRVDHSATRLADGAVLVAGGGRDGAELFEPATQSFTAVDLDILPRSRHASVLASDGRVWLMGGCDGCPFEAVDVRSGLVDQIPAPAVGPAKATPLMDGRILVASRLIVGGPTALLVLDPASGIVTEMEMEVLPTPAASLTLLPSGRVLAVTEAGKLWLVDVVARRARQVGSVEAPFCPRGGRTLDGGVLMVGAHPNVAFFSLWREISPPDPSWRPVLSPDSGEVTVGDTIMLRGSNLLGLSETTDHPSSGRSNHPVAVFMPFDGFPTLGGMRDWSATTASYRSGRPRGVGPGTLYTMVAGQVAGTSLNVVPAPAGTPCVANVACESGVCADIDANGGTGVCCEERCGTCEACTGALKSEGPDGVCGPALAGTDPGDHCEEAPINECSTDGVCDGAGECRLHPDGTPCDEGLVCRSQACVAGCVLNDQCPAGQVCGAAGECIPALVDAEPLGCAPCSARGAVRARWVPWWLLPLTFVARRLTGRGR